GTHDMRADIGTVSNSPMHVFCAEHELRCVDGERIAPEHIRTSATQNKRKRRCYSSSAVSRVSQSSCSCNRYARSMQTSSIYPCTLQSKMFSMGKGVSGMIVCGIVLLSGCEEAGVAREVQSLDGSTVNVRDFGAVGDGTHDDRAAIQAALNSGASFVLVPNGTYAIGTLGACNLSIPEKVTLYGESREGAILLQLPVPVQFTSVRLLRTGPCQNNPPLTRDVTVHDLTLDGNKASQPNNDEHRAGFFATAAENVYVHHVTSRNFTGNGFYFYNNTIPHVDHVLATGNVRDGLMLSGGVPSGSITDSTFIGNAAQQFDSEGGMEFNLVVRKNTIDGTGSNDYAMTVSGLSDAQRSGGWLIDQNTINGGVFFVWTSNMLFTSNTVMNPTTKPAVTGWRSNDGLVIRGNTLTNTQTSVASSAV